MVLFMYQPIVILPTSKLVRFIFVVYVGRFKLNISTFDKMDLCEAVAIAISNIAVKQGKEECIDEVFSMLFDGDFCDAFDGVLGEIE